MPLTQASRIARDASPALRLVARRVADVTAPARPYADRAVSSTTFFGIGFLVGTACWLLLREYVASPGGFAASWLAVLLTGLAAGTMCGFAAMAVAATMQAARARPPASLAHLPDPSPLAAVRPVVAAITAAMRRWIDRRRQAATRRAMARLARAESTGAKSVRAKSVATRSVAAGPRTAPVHATRASSRASAASSSQATATRSTATRARQDGGNRTASLSVVTSRPPKPAATPSRRKSSSSRKR